jgi:hypothetical protein
MVATAVKGDECQMPVHANVVNLRDASGRDEATDATGTMTCENAANIIAGMRGHSDDEDAVRQQLGCITHGPCNVKNVQVLQVLEME